MAMTTPQLQNLIFQVQANLTALQAQLAGRMAAAGDISTLRSTAARSHADQAPQDSGNASAPWSAEEATHGTDEAALWTQPEHAYWLRLAGTAIRAGDMEPVTP